MPTGRRFRNHEWRNIRRKRGRAKQERNRCRQSKFAKLAHIMIPLRIVFRVH